EGKRRVAVGIEDDDVEARQVGGRLGGRRVVDRPGAHAGEGAERRGGRRRHPAEPQDQGGGEQASGQTHAPSASPRVPWMVMALVRRVISKIARTSSWSAQRRRSPPALRACFRVATRAPMPELSM